MIDITLRPIGTRFEYDYPPSAGGNDIDGITATYEIVAYQRIVLPSGRVIISERLRCVDMRYSIPESDYYTGTIGWAVLKKGGGAG